MAKQQPKRRLKPTAKPDGKPKPKAGGPSKRAAVRAVTLTATTPAAPSPSIMSPASGTKINGGEELRLQLSTNRPDVQHYVRVLDPNGNPIPGTPAPIDFSSGSPALESVPMPPAGATDTDYVVQVYTLATPPGTSSQIIVTVPKAPLMVTIAPDTEPNGDEDHPGEYQTDTSLTFTAAVTAGSGSYLYAWSVDNAYLQDTFVSKTKATFDLTLTYPGDYTILAVVADLDPDAAGRAATVTFTLTAYTP